MSTMLITLFAFLAIIVADYLFATFVMNKDDLSENVVDKIISGSMIAASVLANYQAYLQEKRFLALLVSV